MMIKWRPGFASLWLTLSIIWIVLSNLTMIFWFSLWGGFGKRSWEVFVELMLFGEDVALSATAWLFMLAPPLALGILFTIVSVIVNWIKSGPSKRN